MCSRELKTLLARLAAGALLACCVLPQAASAGAVAALTVEGRGFFLDPIHMIEPNCSFSGGSSVSCSGSFIVEEYEFPPYYSFSYLGAARAAYGDLKTSTSLTVRTGMTEEDVAGSGAARLIGSPEGGFLVGASFYDTWTVVGGDLAGLPGSLRLTYRLSGTLVQPPFYESEYFPPQVIGGSQLTFSGGVSGYQYQSDGPVNETVHLLFPFVFDEPFGVQVSMMSNSGMNASSFYDRVATLHTRSDFFSTASLAGIDAFDSAGNPVEFRLAAASGSDEFQRFIGPPAPVPAPAAFWLFTSGLGLLAIQRRVRASLSRKGRGRANA